MAKKLQIVAKTDSFRRAGYEFGSTATLLDPDKLSKEQIEVLKSEPKLVVTEVEVKDDKKGKDNPEAEAKAKAEAEAAAAAAAAGNGGGGKQK